MRNITLLIFVLTLFCSVVEPSLAKKKCTIDANDDSVQMLKQLTESGNVQRAADIPMTKADVEADTARAAKLKKDFAIQQYNDTKAYANIWGKDINFTKSNNKNPE